MIKRVEENTFENNPVYTRWLQGISGAVNPELKVIDNTLCVGCRSRRGTSQSLPSASGNMPQLPEAMAMPEAMSSRVIPSHKETSLSTGAQMPPAGTVSTPVSTASSAIKPENSQVTDAPSSAVSGDASETTALAVMSKIKEIIAEQTGYTTDMLEDTLDLEADLVLTR